MDEPRLFADHLGIYTIMPPKDMPLPVIAMLQETIKEAWADYDGDPHNAEEFWAHLAMGEAVPTSDEVEGLLQEAKSRAGAVDVPRETSRPANAHDALVELVRREERHTEEEWAAYMEEIRRRAVGDVPRETSRFQVDAVYRVNGGALRTAQRTVEAEDWFDARVQVEDKLRAAMPNDELTFSNFSGGVIPDGGPVVADVPRETSEGDNT